MPGVYIAYPFCAQKCTYCNFASGVFARDLERRYVHALCAEIDRYEFRWRPETVYVGGGTPSLADPGGYLARIPAYPWREATLEVAPGTVTREKVRAWSASGINRISLGAQSFVRQELARTGRRHTAETVGSDVQMLRESGISNINIDLIAGLPGQTQTSWDESLDWIDRLAPEHVSVYMLEVDEDSRLGREILRRGARYGAGETLSEDLIADLYQRAVERLHDAGLLRYEISNFARPGFESRHNLKYWKLEPYIGFGAGAHSFVGRRRWCNPDSIEEYLDGRSPELLETHLDEEKFFLGLRLSEGVRPQPEEWIQFQEPIQRFLSAGLLEHEGGTLRLTPHGVLLSNEVFQEFLIA